MDATTIKIPIGKIVSSTDRKYGGEGNIETLAQSIKDHGLIHPLAVKEIPDTKGTYRVIAGRRRFEAIKTLGWKTVDVMVHPEKTDDEAIALAENVNREDMHPLDEAEKFKREIDSGKTADEVAKHYARSVSGIHQRIRLTNLIDGVKTMFRDGKINLSGAALISSLPDKDQEKFFKKHGEQNTDKYEISTFMRSVQKLPIKHIADKKCEMCKTRTHNTTPGLFEDFHGLEEICFNSECYAEKWKELIGKEIKEQGADTTGNNIIIDRGIPEFVPRKAKSVTILGEEYNILAPNSHNWKDTKKKGKVGTAWLVTTSWTMASGLYSLKITRVQYEEQKRQNHSMASNRNEQVDPVKKFKIDHLPDILPEDKKAIAEQLQKKYEYSYNFFREVEETLMTTLLMKRLGEEDKGNMAAFYLEEECGGVDGNRKWHEIDPDYEGFFKLVFGKMFPLSELPKEPMAEKIFKFLVCISAKANDLPDFDDNEDDWKRTEHTLTWKFLQITREDYFDIYRHVLTKAIKKEIEKLNETPTKDDE